MSGDDVKMLKTVERNTACCLMLLTWELDVSAADPPVNLKHLATTLRGMGAGILKELKRLPDELGRAVEATQQGIREFDITLNFASPPQIAACMKELENVKSHPEWLT